MELVKTAKRLKKEKINVDLISFGECEFNQVTLLFVLGDARSFFTHLQGAGIILKPILRGLGETE